MRLRHPATALALALGCTAALTPAASAAESTPPSPALASTPAPELSEPFEALPAGEIAPGVFVHVGAIAFWPDARYPAADLANMSFIVGSECVAVIDTGGSIEAGQRLLATVRQHTALPVCFVINTGAHAPHLLGNHAFARLQPRPTFIGHATLPGALLERTADLPADSLVAPDLLVDSELGIDLGEREVFLRTWPEARSGTELSVLDRNSKTLWTGDLLYALHLPYVDGSLLGWLDAHAPLALIDAERVVPGHGPVSTEWPAVLHLQRDYLDALVGQAGAAWQHRQSMSSLIDGAPAPSGWLLAPMLHPQNLTSAYIELSRD